MPRSPITHSCAVRDEPIRHIGTVKQVRSGDFVPDSFGIYDGADTEAGPICSVCIPVFEQARKEAFAESPDDVEVTREGIRRRLARADFVATCLESYAKSYLLPLLYRRLANGNFCEADAFQLRDFLERGIDVDSYVCSLELTDRYGGINFVGARKCIKEEQRTFKFIKALFVRLIQLGQRRDETIEVVDAGSGPYALFGALAALQSDKARVTCLELNPACAAMSRRVIANLGLSERIRVIEEDATKYRHDRPIDLVVSETMYSGFLQEPLPVVLRNLTPQLAKDGEVIPEWASVEAGLVPSEVAGTAGWWLPDSFALGPISVRRFVRGEFGDVVDFDLPLNGLPAGSYCLALGLKAGLSDKVVLEGGDCPVTIPHLIPGDLSVLSGDTKLRVHYAVGAEDTDVIIEKA